MDVVFGLGSNLGDCLSTLREAVRRLNEVAGVSVTARSALYETDPIGGPEQPVFLNAAVRALCNLKALAVLDVALRVEAELGRTREVRWGPRTIDIDVLFIEGVVVNEPRLVVPHPRLVARAFAVWPLLDVMPAATDPTTGIAYAAVAGALGAQGVRRLGQSL